MGFRKKLHTTLGRLRARWSRLFYYEDYIRVYPDSRRYDRFGNPKASDENWQKNFLNHQKFYNFAAQFAKGSKVVDLGCGSGYGCSILAKHGAQKVAGCDLSEHALEYARSHYSPPVEFSRQAVTDLKQYPDDAFDLAVSCEVLEHVKEYSVEDLALSEARRVTRPSGLLVIGTPNTEMLSDHGFGFREIEALCRRHFREYVLFENALISSGEGRHSWLERERRGEVATVISQDINFDEIVLVKDTKPEIKQGQAPGIIRLGSVKIDTSLLHNTHSWVVVAINP